MVYSFFRLLKPRRYAQIKFVVTYFQMCCLLGTAMENIRLLESTTKVWRWIVN